MIQTIVFYFVAEGLNSSAILAFLRRQMFVCTLFLHFNQIILKRLMLHEIISIIYGRHFPLIDHLSLFLGLLFDWSMNNLSSRVSYFAIIFFFFFRFDNVTSGIQHRCIWLLIFLLNLVKHIFSNDLFWSWWKVCHLCVLISNVQHVSISEAGFRKSISIS